MSEVMDINATEAIENVLDRSKWVKWKFSDLVENVVEKVVPKDSGLDHYIGLKHLDTGSLKIRKFGETESLIGNKLKIYKGDLIFAKRNSYLKRVAIAEFDAVASAHALVLRPNSENVNPDFLPFFMMSEKFWQRAIEISVGSLSPTINWKVLAKQEFLLPPKDQQAQLAKLLWAMDEVIEREVSIKNNLEITLNSFIRKIFTDEIISNSDRETVKCKSLFQTKWEERSLPVNWKPMKLSEALENTQNGFAEGKRDKNGISQLRMNNVTRDGRIDLEKVAMIPSRNNIERYLICDNDVLFCNTNSEDLVGKSILATSIIKDFSFSNHFTRLRGRKELITQKFLYLWLKFHFDIGLFERLCTRWIGQAAVQTESLVRLQIIIPPIKEQENAGNYCQKIEDNIDIVKDKIDSSKSLQKSLINQVF